MKTVLVSWFALLFAIHAFYLSWLPSSQVHGADCGQVKAVRPFRPSSDPTNLVSQAAINANCACQNIEPKLGPGYSSAQPSNKMTIFSCEDPIGTLLNRFGQLIGKTLTEVFDVSKD